MKTSMRPYHGFTLVELLIVTLIVGILASIIAPQFSSSANTARDNAAFSIANNVQGALERYFLDHTRYPKLANFAVCSTSAPQFGDTTVAVGTGADGESIAVQASLAFYSNAAGEVCGSSDSHPYGPYIKLQNGVFPKNPVNGLSAIDVLTSSDGLAPGNAAAVAKRHSDSDNNTWAWVYNPDVGEFAAVQIAQ